jgi:DNA-binding NtrC family response regulator
VPTSPLRVLIIDDDPSYAGMAAEWLRQERHEVTVENSPEGGLARAIEEPFDVVLLDLKMPGMDGMDLIRKLPGDERPEVIILSGEITVRSAVEAMKLGAFDCIPKTEGIETVEVLVRKAGEQHRRKRDLDLLSRRIEHQSTAPDLIARSPKIREILRVLEDIAASNVSVLLTGETGTGKDLLGRLIHRRSPRASGPFVDVNCAALSESLLESELFGYEKGAFTGALTTRPGLVEAADGGTLFLDEVAEMPPALQAKLLRTTENRTLYRVGGRQRIRVDLRIVAATNRDIPREIASGRLREDLYYRLAGVELVVPPLRERPEDVEPLCEFFLKAAVRQFGRGPERVSPAALDALRSYRWPGNVRELKNLIERTALLAHAPAIDVVHLPAELTGGVKVAPPAPGVTAPTDGSLKDLERVQILRVLDEEGWHRARAANRLGLPVRTLYRKIKHYKLVRPSGGQTPPELRGGPVPSPKA